MVTRLYRKFLLKHFLHYTEETNVQTVTVPQAISFIKQAWKCVKSSMAISCWRHPPHPTICGHHTTRWWDQWRKPSTNFTELFHRESHGCWSIQCYWQCKIVSDTGEMRDSDSDDDMLGNAKVPVISKTYIANQSLVRMIQYFVKTLTYE